MNVYHLGLDKKALSEVEIVLLPGDPFRVPVIARAILAEYGTGEMVELAWKREYRTVLVSGRILVVSTGIGGPSAAIAMEELSMLGIKTFIRIGTTGAIQSNIKVGDVVITSASLRMDGTSKSYAPVEYPAFAHHEILMALIDSARLAKLDYHVGVTASTDSFYPGQERIDSCTRNILRSIKGQTEEFRALGVLNYEMESATLLTIASLFGLRCGVVSGVVVNRCNSNSITEEQCKLAEKNAIATGVGALKNWF